ncbi:MAG: NAD(+) diphosphatase [Actinomyces sp.]|uniref:NAD(+) diphosphatase n=1 Tax=Actinomyces sp. TaxID=29317 RepID=UPI0026DBFDBE|nr:NAD(+) diphosphatase [Actinomyces sp.]MDO4244227.1 NAD(+) diphosphatase [Actinomyces sp.]
MSESTHHAPHRQPTAGTPVLPTIEDGWRDRSLARSTNGRDASRRSRPGLLEELAADPATRLLLVDARGRVALDRSGAGPRLAPLTAADLDLAGLRTCYLGRGEPRRDEEDPAAPPSWLAVFVPADLAEATDAEGAARAHPALAQVLDRHPLSPLRAVGAALDAHDAGLATAAVAVAAWHARAGFCPACGHHTSPVEAGWARACSGCQTVQFPRTDPAVIVAATDDNDRLLMVHAAAWEAHRYSVVAGFVEAGEAVEAAVAREVSEETGLEVAELAFVASQPWPFPRSLMLAFRARLVAGSPAPSPDGKEVTGARLVDRRELSEAVSVGEIVLPGPTSIGRMLIEDWYGGPVS